MLGLHGVESLGLAAGVIELKKNSESEFFFGNKLVHGPERFHERYKDRFCGTRRCGPIARTPFGAAVLALIRDALRGIRRKAHFETATVALKTDGLYIFETSQHFAFKSHLVHSTS